MVHKKGTTLAETKAFDGRTRSWTSPTRSSAATRRSVSEWRPVSLPHHGANVEDEQETVAGNGGPPRAKVERDSAVHFLTAATSCAHNVMNCEGLSRVDLMTGNGELMLRKVIRLR